MKNRVGEKYLTNQGYWVEVIEQLNNNNYTIKFEDGLVVYDKQYHHLTKGQIKNPYHPSLFGVGYLSVGKYKAFNGKDLTILYKTWHGMLRRCYDEKHQEKYPTYKDCSVSKEWLNFQMFAEWFEKNYVDGWCLDKDILIKGNKVYSLETCCFIPQEINNLFTKANKIRGKYPIGVSKQGNKFVAKLYKKDRQTHLGYFNTPEEAFQAYKVAKEVYIKEVADKYKGQITDQIYRILIYYKVKIDD